MCILNLKCINFKFTLCYSYTTSTWQHIQTNFKIEPIDLSIIKTEPLNKYVDYVNPTYPNYHGTFDCSMCYEVFDNYEEFIIHKNLTHKLNQLYECRICNEKFGLSAHLNSHLLVHVDYLRLHNTAPLSIKTRSSSKDDSTLSKGKKCIKCSDCNFMTNSELKLSRHQNICKKNTSDELHNCKLCSRSFFNQTALNGHLRYHSLRGDIISKRTLKKNKAHQQMADSVNKSSIKHKMTCQLCNQIFVNKKWLDKHIMKRHGNVQIINGKYFVPQKTMTNILALRNQ